LERWQDLIDQGLRLQPLGLFCGEATGFLHKDRLLGCNFLPCCLWHSQWSTSLRPWVRGWQGPVLQFSQIIQIRTKTKRVLRPSNSLSKFWKTLWHKGTFILQARALCQWSRAQS
jgi:hypothetical protein